MLRHQAPRAHPAPTKGGFSLAEIMVVIVIIGMLATLVVPKVIDDYQRSQIAKAKTDIMTIHNALTEYAIQNSLSYPDSLEALVTPDVHGFTFLVQKAVPLDPWGVPIQYQPPGAGQPEPRVYTLGKDGLPGGIGADADISNLSILGEIRD